MERQTISQVLCLPNIDGRPLPITLNFCQNVAASDLVQIFTNPVKTKVVNVIALAAPPHYMHNHSPPLLNHCFACRVTCQISNAQVGFLSESTDHHNHNNGGHGYQRHCEQ